MMTLAEIKKRNAEYRAQKEREAAKVAEQPEEPKKEIKGRRPKNRRNLVVGDEKPELEENIPEIIPEEKPEPEEEKPEDLGE